MPQNDKMKRLHDIDIIAPLPPPFFKFNFCIIIVCYLTQLEYTYCFMDVGILALKMVVMSK